MDAASVDPGGTNIAGAMAGADGQIVAEKTLPTQSTQGPQAIVRNIASQPSFGVR
jgi:predicted NBD/HSP70 family sugar kinase